MKVNAVIYFRVLNPMDAITKVEDYYFAISQLSQTTLRSVLGQYEMDDLLSNREKINHTLQEILDTATESWGIKITSVEMKQIDLPSEMQRAMARQAEAERERRAKIISADAELERAAKLAEASQNFLSHPRPYLWLSAIPTGDQRRGITNDCIPVTLDIIKPFLIN